MPLLAALIAALVLPAMSVGTGRVKTIRNLQASYSPEALAPAANAAATSAPRTAPHCRNPSRQDRTVPLSRTTAAVALAAYTAFLLFCLARLIFGWLRTVQIRRVAETRVLPEALKDACDSLRRRVRARRSGTAGLVTDRQPGDRGRAPTKPIILPEPLFATEKPELLLTAIGHEMAHVARSDFALKLLYEVFYLPLSFHPASWLIRRGIEQSREMACDELVSKNLLLDPWSMRNRS